VAAQDRSGKRAASGALQDRGRRRDMEGRPRSEREHRSHRRGDGSRNPDVLVAASYQRRRHVWTLIDGGPESTIYKTTDGGEKCGRSRTVFQGRPRTHRSRARARRCRRSLRHRRGVPGRSGFFRSVDGGENWEKRSDYVSGSPQYYQEIIADPLKVDRVYSMDVWMMVTEDGGKTFSRVGRPTSTWTTTRSGSTRGHRSSSRRLRRRGLRELRSRRDLGLHRESPITQFYRVSVDNAAPSTTSTAGPRTTSASEDPRGRRAPTASSTPTGS